MTWFRPPIVKLSVRALGGLRLLGARRGFERSARQERPDRAAAVIPGSALVQYGVGCTARLDVSSPCCVARQGPSQPRDLHLVRNHSCPVASFARRQKAVNKPAVAPESRRPPRRASDGMKRPGDLACAHWGGKGVKNRSRERCQERMTLGFS